MPQEASENPHDPFVRFCFCAFVASGSSEIRRNILRKTTKMEPTLTKNLCKIDLGRFWALETAQDRFFVDFGSVWGGFSLSFGRVFIDLRSSRVRRRHKSRISKKSRVILSARLGSCVVDSLCTARTSFEVIFEHCMFSLFSLRAHKPT